MHCRIQQLFMLFIRANYKLILLCIDLPIKIRLSNDFFQSRHVTTVTSVAEQVGHYTHLSAQVIFVPLQIINNT